MVAEAYLSQCGAFADNVGLCPEAASADEAVMLVKVGDTLCNSPVVPEMSDLPSPAGDPLLGELPRDRSVLCGGPRPHRWGVALCPGVVTVFRVVVEGGMVKGPWEAAQQWARSHCGPDPVMRLCGAFSYCLVGDGCEPMERGEVWVVSRWVWAAKAVC